MAGNSIIESLRQQLQYAREEAERQRKVQEVEQRTPSPARQPALDPHKQTPCSHSTSNLDSTSEGRKYLDGALKTGLENSLILDHPKSTST